MLWIEKVTYSKRGGGCYVLKLDNGETISGLDDGVLQKMTLSPGRELTEEELGTLKAVGESHRARAVASRYINYRPRSRLEVARRLKKAGINESAAAGVLDRLEERGDLDDKAFTLQWVQEKVLGGRSGEKLIKKQLMDRGISRDVIEETLAREFPGEKVLESAMMLVEKKMDGNSALEPKELKKVQDYLLRRGFNWETVERAIKAVGGSSDVDKRL